MMKATVLDTKTGKVLERDGPRSWEWAENNWSCDCNRELMFGGKPIGGVCDGCHRYLVVKAEMNDSEDYEYTLAQLNSGYPAELLATHGISNESGRGSIASVDEKDRL
jgi:hypothetical protein